VLAISGAALAAAAIWILSTQNTAWTGYTEGRFTLEYLSRLVQLFQGLASRYFSRFSMGELLIGTATPTTLVVTGLTRDWAYLDVFYAYGLIGVVGYLLLYGTIIVVAIPGEVSATKRALFALVALGLNFHYGTLNFFVGQFLFSSLAALQLNRTFALSVERSLSRTVPDAPLGLQTPGGPGPMAT
jgi:hypothetical protein